jgi:hypothetical protein
MKALLLLILLGSGFGLMYSALNGLSTGSLTAWITAGIMLATLIVTTRLLTSGNRTQAARRYWVAVPGTDTPSGPYTGKALAHLWQRGTLPPGTQVTTSAKEPTWTDIASHVPTLETLAPQWTGIKATGAVIACLGVLTLFLFHPILGALLLIAGLLLTALS